MKWILVLLSAHWLISGLHAIGNRAPATSFKVNTGDIAPKAITEQKIADAAVTTPKIAPGSLELLHFDSSIVDSTAAPSTLALRDQQGNIAANVVTGNIFKGNVFGNVVGNVMGNVMGNLTGHVIGDITGTATFASMAQFAYSAGNIANNANKNLYLGIDNNNSPSETNTIRIGSSLTHTACIIAGIYGSPCTISSVATFINPGGKLGTLLSSKKYKKNITPLKDASSLLEKLHPVQFEYRDQEGTHFGLIAEEVAHTCPLMAVYGPDGTPESVHYHFLPVLLLEAYQKLTETIADQAKRIQSLEQVLEEASKSHLSLQPPS